MDCRHVSTVVSIVTIDLRAERMKPNSSAPALP